tara:strand:+ start:1321 stop:2148 length:828 start_codon:yes stop_codon:yes gene_type:complete
MSLFGYGLNAAQSLLASTRRALYRPSRFLANDLDRRIVAGLNKEGAFCTSLAELDLSGSQQMLEVARSACGALRQVDDDYVKSYVSLIDLETMIKNAEIFRWGLNERLLAIVEHYIQQSIFYRGVVGRRDYADGKVSGTRLFHVDGEDSRIVKIIVYLDDVDADGGGFEYISKLDGPRPHSIELIDGRVPDAQMADLVPEGKWVNAAGVAGTVLFVDTCNIWHRGRVPVSSDRQTLFFCYNSKSPRMPDSCAPILPFSPMLQDVALTESQVDAIA